MGSKEEAGWPTITSTSVNLLSVARKAVNRSKTERDQATVAILFSAAAIESCINDILEFSKFIDDDPRMESLHALLYEAEEQHARVGLKLQIICAVLRNAPLKRGERLYQDFELLFQLRNSVVHMRPDRGESDFFTHKRKQHKPSQTLIARGIISGKDAESASTWLDIVCSQAVAKWAYQAAVRVALEIYGMITSERLRSVLWTVWGGDRSVTISFPEGMLFVSHR